MADLTGALRDLVQALSGSLGAVISTAAVFPLDKLKARLQVADAKAGASFLSIVREMTKDKGVAGMWEGAVPRMSEQACTKFTYFYLYSYYLALVEGSGDAKQRVGVAMNLLVGYIAAASNNLITMPLQVVSTRAMISGRGAIAEAHDLIQTEGFQALYKGFIPGLILCINPAIAFSVFEQLKRRLLSSPSRAGRNLLTAIEAFWLGAVAKAVATVLTFPFIRVKVVMQASKKKKNVRASDGHSATADSMTDVFKRILRTEGAAALYTGMLPQLIKGVLAAAILFSAKEKIVGFTRALVLALAK